MPDQVHMMMSIPPKYAVSQVIGFLKGNPLCPQGIRREEANLAEQHSSLSKKGLQLAPEPPSDDGIDGMFRNALLARSDG